MQARLWGGEAGGGLTAGPSPRSVCSWSAPPGADLTRTVKDAPVAFGGLRRARRADAEVQQPQGMMGVRLALHHQRAFGDLLHQGPWGVDGEPPQLPPQLLRHLQAFQDGALHGERRGSALALDGLPHVDAEAVGRRLGRRRLALARPLTLPAGGQKAAAQVDAGEQRGPVPRGDGRSRGRQLHKAPLCGHASSSSVTHRKHLCRSARGPPQDSTFLLTLAPFLLGVRDQPHHLHHTLPAALGRRRRGAPEGHAAGLVLAADPPGAIEDAALGAPADAPEGGLPQVGEEGWGAGG